MNFFSIIIFGYSVLAGYLIYIIGRDRKNPAVFFGRHKMSALFTVAVLALGIILAFDARLVEPWTLKATPVTIIDNKITTPVKIAFVSDIQAGNHKKSPWVKVIAERILQEKPDLVILGGDQIDNSGTFEDESVYLRPLQEIAARYPTYAIMGNHEYGIGSGVVGFDQYYTGDRSLEVVARFKELGITLLRDELACPEIRGQKICLYGIDDIWHQTPNFNAFADCHYKAKPKNLNTDNEKPFAAQSGDQDDKCKNASLVFLTHNPDGAKFWPQNLRAPDLVLAGHTHGGQVWIPFLGPLGDAGITLPKKFYRGLNYYDGVPVFTSVGAGESGGAVRFWDLPEIVIITLQ